MRVLVALDGSKVGEHALAVIGPWAAETNAEIHLLTVIDPAKIRETFSTGGWLHALVPRGTPSGALLSVNEPFARATEDRSQALERARTEAADYLGGVAAQHLRGVAAKVHVQWGEHVAEIIAAQASALGADFVAVGTHGRTGLPHVLLGSVAEEVIRRSPVPVLVVRREMSPATIQPAQPPSDAAVDGA